LTAEKNNKKSPRQTEPEEEPKKKETTLEFIASMAAVLITGLFIITFNLQAFEIPSSSMEKTLLIGDHVFVDRISFAPRSSWMPLTHYRDIQRDDIFVFLSPTTPGLYVVKRVIGLPGDRIRLDHGVLFRNGEKVPDTKVDYEGLPPDPYAENFPSIPPDQAMYPVDASWRVELSSYIKNDELIVPKDRYFAMGDHRNVSYDSRYWGFVPKENVIGRPLFIYWSFKTPEGMEGLPVKEQMRFLLGHKILHFFDETRWGRTLSRVK